MMGPRQEAQGAPFYEFSIEGHVPPDHMLRSVDRFADLSTIRQDFAPFYSFTGRPPPKINTTKIDTEVGDVCFCTEAETITAG